jgi:peptidoglycan/LPS O-acetylase OafA/YrhL
MHRIDPRLSKLSSRDKLNRRTAFTTSHFEKPPYMKMNIPALTGARCVAALSVLIAHAAPVMAFQNSLFFMHLAVPLALFGMSLFFVLSGFVIYLNYSALFHERAFSFAFPSFAVARLARLVPAYGFLFLIVAATTSWGNVETQGQNLYLFATLTQSWLPIGAGDDPAAHLFVGMAHTWSISTEFFFYLVFPIVALSLPRATALRSAICKRSPSRCSRSSPSTWFGPRDPGGCRFWAASFPTRHS